jgi:alpha-tubulin suppressor-like RCC1 family protein
VVWGDSNYGLTNVPAGLTNVAAISAGGYHNMVLQADGTVSSWGWNFYGDTIVPGGLSNVVAIGGLGFNAPSPNICSVQLR